jgi:hypothetical protein
VSADRADAREGVSGKKKTFFTHRSVSTFDRATFQLTDEPSVSYGTALR